MTGLALPAETRLARLLERLLTAAETSLAAGDLEPARATAEEVRAVDPENRRAASILQQVAARHVGPSGERVLMTLLFSDLVGSTVMSEQVEPEQLRDLFAFYRSAAQEAVTRYGGTVLHYSGDGILAGFGHPAPHEDDARRAVLAGLDLVVALRDAGPQLADRFGVAPEVRIGMHTGRVVVPDLSDGGAVAERDSVVGLVPNLAARIQQAADPGTVVVSDVTQQMVDSDFFLRSLGERRLKGISRPVEVFAVDRPRYAAARFQAERYRKAGLVGRDEPRDRLLSAWEEVRQGVRPVETSFLVAGEAGIGKSRLVVEVLDRVEASGGQVVGAVCLPYYANVSLWPVARLLERLVGEGGDAGRRDRLRSYLTDAGVDPARGVPFLGPLVGIAPTEEFPAPDLDPSAVLDETLDLLVDWLAGLAAGRPHLLAVEDVHWADPSTVELLGRVVRRRPAGLLAVATTRDAAAFPWPDRLSVVELGRLDGPAANRLVDNLATGKHLDGTARTAILEHAEGIPLFIEELTRSSLDARRGEPIPLRLQELLTWRLKAPGVDLRVVQVAATIGSTFDPATVAAVTGDADLVTDQLRVLADAGIVEPVGLAAGTYRFRHALMRDAAYETQVLDVRRRRHARVADALAARGAEPALVAQHLDLAGATEQAAARYADAGRLELGRGAHPEATRLFSRVLALLESVSPSDERDLGELDAVLMHGLAVSSMQGYASPEVEADHRRAQELAARLGRPEVLPALVALWAYWLTSGRLTTALGVLDQLSAMVAEPAYAAFRPEVSVVAGFQDFHRGRLASAQEHLERAQEEFAVRPADERVGPLWPLPDDPIAAAASVLAAVGAMRGDLDASRRWEEVALGRAAEIGSPQGPSTAILVKCYVSIIRYFLGDDDAASRAGWDMVAVGREHGLPFRTAWGAAWAATGTPGGAPDRAFLEDALATLERTGWLTFLPFHLAHLARLDAAAGDLDRADRHLTEAFGAVRRMGEEIHLPDLLRQRAGLTLLRGGEPAAAAADLVEAVRIATGQGARVSRLRAAVELARLPASSRPPDWRDLLAEARADVPSAYVAEETAAADELLGG